MEQFKLTEDEKDMFFEKYNLGDCNALDYLYNLIVADTNRKGYTEELEELAYRVCNLNRMNDIVECEHWKSFKQHEDAIVNLYFDMKRTLLDAVGITDEDWYNYTGC